MLPVHQFRKQKACAAINKRHPVISYLLQGSMQPGQYYKAVLPTCTASYGVIPTTRNLGQCTQILIASHKLFASENNVMFRRSIAKSGSCFKASKRMFRLQEPFPELWYINLYTCTLWICPDQCTKFFYWCQGCLCITKVTCYEQQNNTGKLRYIYKCVCSLSNVTSVAATACQTPSSWCASNLLLPWIDLAIGACHTRA